MDHLLKIGEVAKQLATSVRTIRYYEEEGLLLPIRTEGGTRLYSPAHIGRLKAILQLAHSGFSIESIHAICCIRETCQTGDESSQQVTHALSAAQDTLNRQIQALHTLKQEVAAAQQVVQQCSGCQNSPTTHGCPTCPVRQHLPVNGQRNAAITERVSGRTPRHK